MQRRPEHGEQRGCEKRRPAPEQHARGIPQQRRRPEHEHQRQHSRPGQPAHAVSQRAQRRVEHRRPREIRRERRNRRTVQPVRPLQMPRPQVRGLVRIRGVRTLAAAPTAPPARQAPPAAASHPTLARRRHEAPGGALAPVFRSPVRAHVPSPPAARPPVQAPTAGFPARLPSGACPPARPRLATHIAARHPTHLPHQNQRAHPGEETPRHQPSACHRYAASTGPTPSGGYELPQADRSHIATAGGGVPRTGVFRKKRSGRGRIPAGPLPNFPVRAARRGPPARGARIARGGHAGHGAGRR